MDCFLVVVERSDHDTRMFRSDIVDSLSQINRFVAVFPPEFKQKLGEAE